VILALGSAFLFAAGLVVQQKIAATTSSADALRFGFVLRLARRPQWLTGLGLDAGGFLCQAAALAVGRLVVVQPILATSVVFALLFRNRLTGAAASLGLPSRSPPGLPSSSRLRIRAVAGGMPQEAPGSPRAPRLPRCAAPSW
jgi:hypothetical protein